MSDQTVLVGNFRTGQIESTLPATGLKWGSRINGDGPLEVTLNIFSEEVSGWVEQLPVSILGLPLESLTLGSGSSAGVRRARKIALRQLTAPILQFLAIQQGDRILEAGQIRGRSFDDKTGELTLTCGGIWTYLSSNRKLMNTTAVQPGAKPATGGLRYDDESLGDIARSIVQWSMLHTGGDIPIVVGPMDNGTGHDRTYWGYDLPWVGEELKSLTEAEGGPEIRFQPRFDVADPSKIVWDMLVGTPVLAQKGASWVFDATREGSGVTDLATDEDGSELAFRMWVPGNGQEKKMLLSRADDLTLVNAGYPLMEGEVAHKSVVKQSTLDAYARQHLYEASGLWDTYKVSVRADESPKLGEYSVGDFAMVFVGDDHPLLLPGPKRVRIMSIDGSDGPEVTLGLTPILEELV